MDGPLGGEPEHVAHEDLLGLHVGRVLVVERGNQRNPLDDAKAVVRDAVVLLLVVRHEAHGTHAEAWIDRIAVAGKTFRYTEEGPEGLAGDKKVFIVSSRGGFHSQGTPTAFLDHQETYLKNLPGFLAEAGRGDTWHRSRERRRP